MTIDPITTTTPPPVLYHYTTQAGLLGILESNCLWATAAQYLNDSSEYEYGLQLIADRLSSTAKEAVDETVAAKLAEIAKDLSPFPGVCVVSLTKDGDLLSQWRAYGGRAGGVALGFCAAHLSNIAQEQGFELVRCLYTDAQKHAAIDTLIRGLCH